MQTARTTIWWQSFLAVVAAAAVALLARPAFAQEADTQVTESEGPESVEDAVSDEQGPQTDGQDPDQPRSMSGMSILGNEEAPKSLVIIPWKSSQLGDDINLDNSLDDQATPVDKDVFLRELRFHEIRSGE